MTKKSLVLIFNYVHVYSVARKMLRKIFICSSYLLVFLQVNVFRDQNNEGVANFISQRFRSFFSFGS